MIRCFSLIDLGNETNINKNWISLLQSISLYSDFEILCYPKKVCRDINGLDFGKSYSGFHNIWIFDFEDKKTKDTTSLEAHVDICAERYDKMETKMETMETRLEKVETIVSDIKRLLIEKETLAYKKLVGLGIGIIGSLLTALLGLILYVAKAHS